MTRLQERERNDSQNEVGRATAMAAAEEQCYRRVVDLQRAARELNKLDFEKHAATIDKMDQGLFVPSQAPLSMSDASTWTKCFCEFWYGDALPNSARPRKLLSRIHG